MEQRLDYIEVEINKLGIFLRKLLEKLLRLKNTDEKLPDLQEILSVEEFENMDENELTSFIDTHKHFDLANLKLLAAIYYQRFKNEPNNKLLGTKSLRLYKLLLKKSMGSIDMEAFQKIEQLEKLTAI